MEGPSNITGGALQIFHTSVYLNMHINYVNRKNKI
jgi:hypothetical protein